MAGFYLMQRGWMEGGLFYGDGFCRRAAWAWLVEEAAFKAKIFDHAGQSVTLERGQLFTSLRFMAKAWKWDDSKVRRFLEAAKRQNMIRSEAVAGQTRITICNYEELQSSQRTDDAPETRDEHAEAASPPQNRKNVNEGKEGKDSIAIPDLVDSDFAEWYRAYPRKIDRAKALKAYRTAHKEVGGQELSEGLARYAEHCRVNRTEERFIKHPTSWLNARGWENDYSIKPPDPPSPPPRRKTKHDEDMEWLEQWGQSGDSYPDHEGGPIIDHEPTDNFGP